MPTTYGQSLVSIRSSPNHSAHTSQVPLCAVIIEASARRVTRSPGTGKSQTIANVISALVASGKHVLFVAQKRAAITAVPDRLDAVDLSHLLLGLFAADGAQRFVAEQLNAMLERQQQVGVPETAELRAKLQRARSRLVGHNDALFRPTHGWGTSIHDLRVASLGSPTWAQTALRLPPHTFNTGDSTTLDRLAEGAR